MKPRPLLFYNPQWTIFEKLDRLRMIRPRAAQGVEMLVTEFLETAWRHDFGPDPKGRGCKPDSAKD